MNRKRTLLITGLIVAAAAALGKPYPDAVFLLRSESGALYREIENHAVTVIKELRRLKAAEKEWMTALRDKGYIMTAGDNTIQLSVLTDDVDALLKDLQPFLLTAPFPATALSIENRKQLYRLGITFELSGPATAQKEVVH